MLNISQLSTKYRIKKMEEEDISRILNIENGNPQYFEYCPPKPCRETVLNDLKALPEGKSLEDKFYIGFFKNDSLIAIMDFILSFPKEDMVFIGLFMMDSKESGKGKGSAIIIEALTAWKSEGYENKLMKDQFEISQNEKLRKDIKRLKEAARQSQIWSDKVENAKNGVKVSGVKPDKGHIGHQSAKMMKKSKNLENRQNKAIEEKQNLLKDIETKESLLLHPLHHHKDPLISVSNLSSCYGERQILRDVSFDIKQGDIVAIYGGNGSGKSTLIKILLGINHEYSGDVKLASNLKISYIPQDTSNLTGSLNEYIDSQGVDETLCKTILRKLDFARELFEIDMKNYSDGQKKKVLIAVSISKPVHIFIWDEPLNYIDVISRIQIEEIIKESKPTLIFVEHDKRFVEDIANKIIRL